MSNERSKSKHLNIIKQLLSQGSESSSLRDLLDLIKQNRYVRASWFTKWKETARQETRIGLWQLIKSYFINRKSFQANRVSVFIRKHAEQVRTELNDYIIARTIETHRSFFNSVESNPLTIKQCEAVASDEDCTLIIAGAGTGKTSTILAKIGLLLKTGQCRPEEILAISFTRKSAGELAERVKSRLNVDVSISTFHKLGLDIISTAKRGKPSLAPFTSERDDKVRHIERLLKELKDDATFSKRLLEFLAYQRVPYKSLWEFKDLSEYKAWLDGHSLVSLKGERMHSIEECIIANWLLLNGIPYEYERPYEIETCTIERRQYCPDFYLPGIKTYLEHFGIDKNEMPASFINADEYRKGMAWKRQIHRLNSTSLIETYSWQHADGILLDHLKRELRARGVEFRPISNDDAVALLNREGIVSGFSELVSTFLTLFKGNGQSLARSVTNKPVAKKNRENAFLEIFRGILAKYESENTANGQIDFEDMINNAVHCVEAGDYISKYKYILIDEFQDISPGRIALVRALQKSVQGCALFAVGDDWQSVYRFTGSDIGAMTKFSSHFGATRVVPLDETFRFDSKTAEVSNAFILKNKVQIRKEIKPRRVSNKPSVVLYKRAGKEAPLDWCLKQIASEEIKDPDVMILERYNFHLPQEEEWVNIQKQYKSMKFRKMSIHAAKGLEADYVIMGLRGGKWGFPAQVVDDPLLELVLTQPDEFEFGEERRLFYVGITRSKRKTFIVSETGSAKSLFAKELEDDKEYPIQVIGIDERALSCRKCKSGFMMLRDGSNGKFYGCSNYPLCSHTEQVCPKCREGLIIEKIGLFSCHICGHQVRICPRCRSGQLQERNGIYGRFLGCSNYFDPDLKCDYTENVRRKQTYH